MSTVGERMEWPVTTRRNCRDAKPLAPCRHLRRVFEAAKRGVLPPVATVSKVDALRTVVSAYSQPNNSKAQTARVKKALLDLGFAGGDLVSAMVMLGWNEKDAT